MKTTDNTVEDWTSAWPDAVALAGGLAAAWWYKWTTTDLVWSLWLSSLVVGYATIVWTILRPAVDIARGAWRDRALTAQLLAQTGLWSAVPAGVLLLAGGLLLLTFFAVHFGMFHFVHSQFLGVFFPIEVGTAGQRVAVGMSTYLEVTRRYWWFLLPAFLAERGAFVRGSTPVEQDRSVTAAAILARKAVTASTSGNGVMAPYRNVVRMHLLIFFFALAHAARLDNFAVYAVVYAVYFFPWRLVRRGVAIEPTPLSSGR